MSDDPAVTGKIALAHLNELPDSVACIPTDAMPLIRWAKLAMRESAPAAITVLFVAARSVNIFR